MRFPPAIVAQTDPLHIGGHRCIELPIGLVPWDEAQQRTTIVAKTTYAFDPSAAKPKLELLTQQPEFTTAQTSTRAGASELELDDPADLVRAKPRADVLVVGHAYAGSAVARIDARIAIQGAVDVAFCVVGPSPIERIPLGAGYLRAADGVTPIPPVGPIREREVVPLSEQEDAYGLTEEEKQAQREAAIRAIDAGEWKPWEAHGFIDANDVVDDAPDSELPEAAFIDPPDVETWDDLHETVPLLDRGVQFAAAHLCCPFLDPDAALELDGLTLGGGHTTLQLPGHDVLVIAEAGAKYDVGMEVDTVVIDAEKCRVSLTWRGQVPVDLFALSGARIVVALGFVDRVPTLDAIYRNLPRGVFSRASVPEDAGAMPAPRNDVALAVARQMTFDRVPDPILDMDEYTDVVAEIAARPDAAAAILADHDMTREDWMLEERGWTSRIGSAMSANDLEAVHAFNKLMKTKRGAALEQAKGDTKEQGS